MQVRKSRKRRSRSPCIYGRKKSMRQGCKSRPGPKRRSRKRSPRRMRKRSVRRRSRKRSPRRLRKRSIKRSVRRRSRYRYNMDKKKLTIEKYDRKWPIRCYWTYNPNGANPRRANNARLNRILSKFRSSRLNASEYFCGQPKGSIRIGQHYVHDAIADAADHTVDTNAIWFEDATGELLAICVWSHMNLSETKQQYIDILADHGNIEALQIQKAFNEFTEKENQIHQIPSRELPRMARELGIEERYYSESFVLERLIDEAAKEYDRLGANMSAELNQEIDNIKKMQKDYNLHIDLLCTRPAGRSNGFAAELIYLLAYFHQYDGKDSCGKSKFVVSLEALDSDEKGPVFKLYERLGAKPYRKSNYQIWNAYDICEKWRNCKESSLFHCRTTSDVDIIVNQLQSKGYFEYNPDITPMDHQLREHSPAKPFVTNTFNIPMPPSLMQAPMMSVSPPVTPAVPRAVVPTPTAPTPVPAGVVCRDGRCMRVPKPTPTAPHGSRPTGRAPRTTTATYVDNPINRSLGRVGLPLGTHRKPSGSRQRAPRPSPSIPAAEAANQIMKGGDGNLWISQRRGSTSPFRWYRQSTLESNPTRLSGRLNCKKFKKTVAPTCESHPECVWKVGRGCENR